ncbi:MAG: HAD hydrolase-like protein [Planctomycetes bacterium]|nr:HAD hydrolase-like protein [Planctomycetota bacterium]
MHVLLFDIDGTLIRSGGAGKAAMEEALRSEFGIAEIRDGVPFSGRTDPSIGVDLLKLHGVEPEDANMHRLSSAYLGHLPGMLNRYGGIVLPGVRAMLDRLHGQKLVALGLLTGNVLEGARRKLTHFDLWHYFPFGAFADGIHERDDIARASIAEIKRHVGREVPAENIWVIGDTPFDVKCARAIGAKAVAVATGWHSLEELQGTKADYVFEDFRDVSALLREWGIG